MSELVSVVMPAHDVAPYLEASVSSVLAQTHTQLEVIVVDDASSDATAAIAARLAARDARVRVIRFRTNVGAARARNAGIETALGRYIAFLDSDDLWLPDKTARQLQAFRETGAALCYTGYGTIDEEGRVRNAAMHVPERVTHAELLNSNVIPCSSAMYDTRRVGKRYMPDIRKRQDYGLWLALLKDAERRSHPAAVGIDEPLMLYRVRAQSVSSNKLSAARYQWRIYRELERLSLWRSFYCFAHYAILGAIKHQRH